MSRRWLICSSDCLLRSLPKQRASPDTKNGDFLIDTSAPAEYDRMVSCQKIESSALNVYMANRAEILQAELNAIILWDRMYMQNPAPDSIEKDACIARIFRRVQIVTELSLFAPVSKKDDPTKLEGQPTQDQFWLEWGCSHVIDLGQRTN